MTLSLHPSRGLPPSLPRIVAVGFRRINKMLQELAPQFADRARVEVLDMGYEQAVSGLRSLQRERPVDVVVAAGSNGGYLRQRLDTPVVLVKVGGFDLMRALAQARQVSARVGLVTYEGMAPDIRQFDGLFELEVVQRTYQTEDEAQASVRALQQEGVQVVVGTGVVADTADQLGLTGVFLYSRDAVREALEDAVEVARAARIEQAKRERLNTILAQLSDGVIAVDQEERVQTLNPAMAQLLSVAPGAWVGQRLSEVCPELSLLATLRLAVPDLERIERVKGKALIVNRMPILEQGVLTGAVLSCQDPISIQRVDRHIRTRIKPVASSPRHELDAFLGDSPVARQLRETASACARSQATVLLIGESGTGKELVAQGIHRASERRDMPFVAVNCAALSESLLESELFGYEEGAFTGARKGGKIGLFEAAHNGTLFLDEVGEMPPSLQARLLRVLQAREVLRVGATEPTPVNVRVIAATHRDLSAQVEQGLFRLDLYYRLNILRVDVPPLRAHLPDIALIAEAVARQVCRRLQLDPSAAGPLLQALVVQAPHHAWPGNVRELENLIERWMAYAGAEASRLPMTSEVAREQLRRVAPELFGGHGQPSAMQPGRAEPSTSPASAALPRSRGAVPAANQQELLEAWEACAGDRSQMCALLGISRTTLWRRLRAAGLEA
ncbi:MAG: propionate catabolism operon regulatory protein PrpR [Aquabacterium sp.]